jgi:hypothetical protein
MVTNMAVSAENNKILDVILSKPNVAFGVSFETIGDRYEYVRHGASWDTFNNNLKTVRERSPTTKLNVHPIYCTYSAFNLVEFYDFVLNAGFTKIYWAVIHNIEGLDIFNLSKELKLKAIKEIELCAELYPEDNSIKDLLNIKKSLENSFENRLIVSNISGLEKFRIYTDEIEEQLKNKKKKAIELWPELFLELTDEEILK